MGIKKYLKGKNATLRLQSDPIGNMRRIHTPMRNRVFGMARSRTAQVLSGLYLVALFLWTLPSQARGLEQLIASALATHPSTQGQRALVQSA